MKNTLASYSVRFLLGAFSLMLAMGVTALLSAADASMCVPQEVVRADNVLGTLSAALIIQRALELVFTKRPILNLISRDLSAEPVKYNQQVISRIHSIPPVENFGTAASDRADVDVPVTINQFKQVRHKFTIQELSATDRNLVDESAEPMAVAIANHMVDAVAALWTLTNFENETVEAVADSDYETMVALRKALVGRGAPETRFAVVSDAVYAELITDARLINANQNPGQSTIQDGVLSNVAGFRNIFEYPALPDDDSMIGFAGTPDSVVIASRVPKDPREVLPSAGFPGNLGVITEPKTGLSVMVVEHIDPDDLSANVKLVWMYGVAKGNVNNGQRLVHTTNDD